MTIPKRRRVDSTATDAKVRSLTWHVVRTSDGRVMAGAPNAETALRTAVVLGGGYEVRRAQRQRAKSN